MREPPQRWFAAEGRSERRHRPGGRAGRGDVMKLQVKVNPETGIIDDAKFKTFGCGSAIASSSPRPSGLAGKSVEEAPPSRTPTSSPNHAAAGEDSLPVLAGRRHQGRDQRLQDPEVGRREGRLRRGDAAGGNSRFGGPGKKAPPEGLKRPRELNSTFPALLVQAVPA